MKKKLSIIFSTALLSFSTSADWLPANFITNIEAVQVTSTGFERSGRCVGYNLSDYPNLELDTSHCRTTNWSAQGVSDPNTFRFHSYVNRWQCMDDYERSHQVAMWQCHGGSNQKWKPVITSRIDSPGTPEVRTFKLVTGKNYCLTLVRGATFGQPDRTEVAPCDGRVNQNWFLNGLDFFPDDE